MAYKVGMVSLGCSKNQIDAEIMLSILQKEGFIITADENEADAIIINTCGFIEDAKKEAIDNILETAQLKKTAKLKALIVSGCLAERYKEEITKEMPEVDAVLGIGSNADIANIVKSAIEGNPYNSFCEKEKLILNGDRLITTPPYTAYLKIADGCDNCCTYCAIPMIRGRFRSRETEQIINEAQSLAENGAKEIILIAQDTTRYGIDIYGEYALPRLLNELCKIEGIEWIRILYAYPEKITDELIQTMKSQKKILHYLDIPLQHASTDVLKRMNRKSNTQSLYAVIKKLRAEIPDITLRTTFMVGFPGETENDFEQLARFVKDVKFNRMGCFTYSAEEGTAAAGFDNQIDEEIKQRRRDVLMTEQSVVNEQLCAEKIGETVEVLVEGYDKLNKCWFGRSKADAPDIDGKVFFITDKKLSPGDIIRVKVFDTIDYDLLGDIVD